MLAIIRIPDSIEARKVVDKADGALGCILRSDVCCDCGVEVLDTLHRGGFEAGGVQRKQVGEDDLHSAVAGAHLGDEDVVGGEDLDNGFLTDENVVGADEHDDYVRGILLQLGYQVGGGSPGSCLRSGVAFVVLVDVGARAC